MMLVCRRKRLTTVANEREQGPGNESIGAEVLYISQGQSRARSIGTIGQMKGVELLSLPLRIVPPIHRHTCIPWIGRILGE